MALFECHFFSETLQLTSSMLVILPQRPLAAAPAPLYQTLYLLHGLSDDHTIWQRRTSIERYVDVLAPSLAVVMPAVDRSFYTDMACGNRYWTFVSEELPALARSFFPLSPAREDNFVAGLSMGGYGAFKLALSCPQSFAAAASLSGALDAAEMVREPDPAWQAQMRATFGDLAQVAGSPNDLFFLAQQLAACGRPRPALYQWCGTEDFLYQHNLNFKQAVEAAGLELTYREGPGDHQWLYWDQQIQQVLSWLPLRSLA